MEKPDHKLLSGLCRSTLDSPGNFRHAQPRRTDPLYEILNSHEYLVYTTNHYACIRQLNTVELQPYGTIPLEGKLPHDRWGAANGYLPSRRTSLPCDWYTELYCLAIRRHMYVWITCPRSLPGVEPATSRVLSERDIHYATRTDRALCERHEL